jgi:hypothetical protein
VWKTFILLHARFCSFIPKNTGLQIGKETSFFPIISLATQCTTFIYILDAILIERKAVLTVELCLLHTTHEFLKWSIKYSQPVVFSGHKKQVTALCFGNKNEQILLASASEECVIVWFLEKNFYLDGEYPKRSNKSGLIMMS